MNIDLSKALVSPDIIVAEVKQVFPKYALYAMNHTAYTTNKICHREAQRVQEHLINRGFMLP